MFEVESSGTVARCRDVNSSESSTKEFDKKSDMELEFGPDSIIHRQIFYTDWL